jgi:hypothetical protein
MEERPEHKCVTVNFDDLGQWADGTTRVRRGQSMRVRNVDLTDPGFRFAESYGPSK